MKKAPPDPRKNFFEKGAEMLPRLFFGVRRSYKRSGAEYSAPFSEKF